MVEAVTDDNKKLVAELDRLQQELNSQKLIQTKKTERKKAEQSTLEGILSFLGFGQGNKDSGLNFESEFNSKI